MSNALIIGYGSIGKLHEKILKKLHCFQKIYIFSSQFINHTKQIKNLYDVRDLNISYIVIASPTSFHFKHLNIINQQLKNKKILIEKPLFESLLKHNLKLRNKIYVGYDLRFHPIIAKIKNLVKRKKIWSINIFCGSYMPYWRPGRDYSKTSSANKKLGGGVLLDLSHEIDYLSWIFGKFQIQYSFNKKKSNLKIDTDDTLIIISTFKKNIICNLSLNYYTKKALRQIIIDGDNISIFADIFKNELIYYTNNKKIYLKYKDIKRETTQQSMHKNLLKSNNIICCDFKEAYKTMKVINEVRNKK